MGAAVEGMGKGKVREGHECSAGRPSKCQEARGSLIPARGQQVVWQAGKGGGDERDVDSSAAVESAAVTRRAPTTRAAFGPQQGVPPMRHCTAMFCCLLQVVPLPRHGALLRAAGAGLPYGGGGSGGGGGLHAAGGRRLGGVRERWWRRGRLRGFGCFRGSSAGARQQQQQRHVLHLCTRNGGR